MLFLTVHVGLFAQRNPPKIPDSIQLESYPQLAEDLLFYFENHGYPFATVSLQSTNPDAGDFTPRIVIDTNLFVTFDSIVIKGDVKLAPGFLYPYLGLKRGKPYQEQLMRQARQKLEELPYATVLRDADVSFVKDKAYLYVYLDKRQASRFDGYLGIVPTDERTGKISFHGELDLALRNLFHLGESILIDWNGYGRRSQKLNLSVRFPYLFRTRFGVNGVFSLDKQDTSYTTVSLQAGIPYSFINNSYIEPYFNFENSTVLHSEAPSAGNENLYASYRKTLYGLRMRYRKLDYLYNPRRGFDISADLSAGSRLLRATGNESDYGTESHATGSYRLTGDVRGYIPLGKRWVLVPRTQAGSLLSGPHGENELFKIAGVDFIRGFNPNELIASTYWLYSMEVRLIFAKKSFVHLFFDGGIYEQQLTGRYLHDAPFGFGAGVNIAVRSGTFYLEYALGQQMKNPISLKRGIIHFGVKVDF